jgi:hypothetical protein
MDIRPRHSLVAALLLAVTLATCLGCSSDDGTPTEPVTACTGDVSITVSSGLTPTFNWSPACGAMTLDVQEGIGAASTRWAISGNSATLLRPGIRYGTVPSGATEPVASQALETGHTYTVFVYRGEAGTELADSKEFTP